MKTEPGNVEIKTVRDRQKSAGTPKQPQPQQGTMANAFAKALKK